jgi:opacity protein-like surface antigen
MGRNIMGRNKALWFMCFIAAAGVQCAQKPAFAADILPPAPPLEDPSLRGALDEDSGFYIRLDAGFANTNATKLRSIYGDLGAIKGPVSIGDPFILGLGAGYQFNTWLRADLTGEYRQGVHYHASSTAQFVGSALCPIGGPVSCGDDVAATVKTELFLANGYIDIGNFSGVRPYVGAGVGVAPYQVSALRDKALFATDAFGFAPNASGANFAWSLTAGATFSLSPNLLVDISYRYVNMGSFKTGVICNDQGPDRRHLESQHFNMASNDLRIGLRWLMFDPGLPPSEVSARY